MRPFAGRPLYRHILETLMRAEAVDAVVIDTDDTKLAAEIHRDFSTVRLLQRPEELAGDMASAHEIVRNSVTQIEGSHFLQTHATNPLVRPETIDRAVQAYFDARPGHDSLFSVTPIFKRFYTRAGAAINHDPRGIVRTQDLDPLLEENSCLYVFDRDTILRRRMRIGERPLPFEMPPEESMDIDEELDLVIGEAIHGARAAMSSRPT